MPRIISQRFLPAQLPRLSSVLPRSPLIVRSRETNIPLARGEPEGRAAQQALCGVRLIYLQPANIGKLLWSPRPVVVSFSSRAAAPRNSTPRQPLVSGSFGSYAPRCEQSYQHRAVFGPLGVDIHQPSGCREAGAMRGASDSAALITLFTTLRSLLPRRMSPPRRFAALANRAWQASLRSVVFRSLRRAN